MTRKHRIHPNPTLSGLRIMPLLLVVVAALATLSALAPAPMSVHAAAAQGATFGIQPAAGTDPHLRFTLEPGQSVDAEVRIRNRGTVAGAALSFVANAESLVGGGFGVASVSAPRDGATLWVDFPDEVTELAAGAEAIRTLTVQVPENTPPGDYIIGMAVQDAPVTDDSNSAGDVGVHLKIVNRQAMAIMINVPGERTPALAVGQVAMEDGSQGSTIAITVANAGNTHLTPVGRVQVATLAGEQLADVNVELGRVYAGTTTAISLPVDGHLPVGTYLVSTEVWDETADVRAAAAEQQLVVQPRELPNGEQAATLESDAARIQAPVGTTQGSAAGNATGGSANMLMAGIGVGAGVAVALGAGAALLMYMRRPRVVVAQIVPSDRRVDEWQ